MVREFKIVDEQMFEYSEGGMVLEVASPALLRRHGLKRRCTGPSQRLEFLDILKDSQDKSGSCYVLLCLGEAWLQGAAVNSMGAR